MTFTLCKERRQYGELIKPMPSRFLEELPYDDVEWEEKKKPQTQEERMAKGQAAIANLRAMLKNSIESRSNPAFSLWLQRFLR